MGWIIVFRNISAVVFKISEYCNLDCEYCFQKFETKTHHAKFEMYDELIYFLSKLPLDEDLEFKITGGESSLFIDDIRYAYKKLSKLERKQDIKINFTTISNGTNMKGLINLMDEGILRPWGCKYSWDGIHSASKSRKPKNSLYTDEFFNGKVKLIGQSKYNKDILVRIALTPNTVDDLAKSFKYALECGCRKLEYYYLTDCEEYKTQEFYHKFALAMRDIIALMYKYEGFTFSNFDTLFMNESLKEGEKLRAIACRHLGKSLYIEIDGKVAPCGYFSKDALFPDQTMYIGDIKEGFYYDKVKSFIDQYKSAPMCYKNGCKNFHCFECPATALFRKGNMSEKLYQTCRLRTLEKETYDRESTNYLFFRYNFNKTFWEKRFSYMKDWNVDYSMPKLNYKR